MTYSYVVLIEKNPEKFEEQIDHFGSDGFRVIHIQSWDEYLLAVMEFKEE